MPREFNVELPSGRILEVSEGGDPKGLPIFCLHGTPGSRLLYPPHVADAVTLHIRLIGFNRPGYGGSTPFPGRRIVDIAFDVEAIADSMGLDRFAVYGYSGGGAPALACAAILPQRVVAASSLAGVAPYAADGLDWFAGMGDFNVEDYMLMLRNRSEWELKSRKDADIILKATRADLVQIWDTLLCEVDKSVLSDEVIVFLQDQSIEAYEVGIRGACDDNISQSGAWGFDPASIKVPVQIWHGRHDRFVPFFHGKWLASRIPQAEAHLENEEGHLSLIVKRVPDVHRWLAAKF